MLEMADPYFMSLCHTAEWDYTAVGDDAEKPKVQKVKS